MTARRYTVYLVTRVGLLALFVSGVMAGAGLLLAVQMIAGALWR